MRGGQKIGTARQLRRRQTDAEKALWRLLRNRALSGAKFRRQQPIDRYVVDFVCLEANLIIELDGGQHMVNEGADLARTEDLNDLGFRVLRIWNNDMLTNPEGVSRVILKALNAPHPNPLPQAGEGVRPSKNKPLARLREREGPAAKRWEGEGRLS